MSTPETESGFGSGLRAKLTGEVAADQPAVDAAPAAPDLLQELFVARPEQTAPVSDSAVEAVRVELEAALARERGLRETLQHQIEAYERELANGREAAVREAELAQQAARLESVRVELEEQQLMLRIQLDQAETERAELSGRRAELVSEEARVTELATHVDSRAVELASADSERAQASAHLAQQLAGIAERDLAAYVRDLQGSLSTRSVA